MDLKHQLDILLDAAEDGSASRMIKPFFDAFADHFGTDSATLIDKGRMQKVDIRLPDHKSMIPKLRNFALQKLQESLQLGPALANSSLASAGRLGAIAYDAKYIMTCVMRIEGLSELDESLDENDSSGNIGAFGRVEPMDPNDRLRQQTQARAGNYPYDMPVSYGKAIGTDSGGASYQIGSGPATDGPPEGEEEPTDLTTPQSAWNALEAFGKGTPPMETGPTGPFADLYGYGRNGMQGEADEIDLDMDSNRSEFMGSFDDEPEGEDDHPLVTLLLVDVEPESDEDDGEGPLSSMFHSRALADRAPDDKEMP